MKTKIVRYMFNHRAVPKRLISKIFPNPILLNLADFKMYVRLDDWAVGARIAVNRSYEKHVTREMRRFLKPGLVLVDIGANIGYYTLLASSYLGETGKVIAFEPSAENCDLLKMSVEKNKFRQVELCMKAVADTNRMVGLIMDDSNGRINQEQPDTWSNQVEAVRLDDALQNVSRIDLIKMDVEGAEGLVMTGAEKLMQTHLPVVFTEFRPPSLEYRSRMTGAEFLDRFRKLDYELYVIDRKRGASPSPQSNAEILESYEQVKPSHIDLMAIPR